MAEPDFKALDAAMRAGWAAEESLADYYDNLTPEQLEAEFANAEPVEIVTPPEGISVTWKVKFAPGEIEAVTRAAREMDLPVGAYLKHLALLDSRGHALTATPGAAACEHFVISGVVEAACPACGPLPISRTVITSA